MDIYLASTSPRRRQLLAEIVGEFKAVSPQTEEKEYPGFTPKENAVRRSKDKCIAAVNHLKDMSAVIIASDTVVDFCGRTLDITENSTQAYNMISGMSGKMHRVHTAVSVYAQGSVFTFCDTTKVYFREIQPDVIMEYVKTDIPYDKRGGYGIQTEYGSIFVEKIEGDYNTVVGLPVKRLEKLLNFLNIL